MILLTADLTPDELPIVVDFSPLVFSHMEKSPPESSELDLLLLFGQSLTFRFRNFSVSKLFDFFNGIGIGFGKFWYRKKYRYRFRKNLVSKKVSVSVSKNFGIEKSISFKKFGIQKVSDSETRNPLKNIKGWRCLFLPMTGNPLKNIKGWWCLFLPIRKSSQKYQGVAVLFSADDRKSSQKYQGVAVLV